MHKLERGYVTAVERSYATPYCFVGMRLPGALSQAQQDRIHVPLIRRFQRIAYEVIIKQDLEDGQVVTYMWALLSPISLCELNNAMVWFGRVLEEIGVVETAEPTSPLPAHWNA
jgi:hypothetical protein